MAAPKADKGDTLIALWDYESASKEELTFKKGDKFKLLKLVDDGWWHVQALAKRGKKGYINAPLMALEDSLDQYDWYHGPISRGGAEYLLQRHKQPGTYLVRESQTQPGSYTITLFDGSRILHYRINEDGTEYNVRPGTNFPTIQELIQHLEGDPDGISICLTQTVPKAHARAVVISKKVDKQWELKRSDIKLGRVLGSGNYGDVHVASYAPLNCDVAVKTVKEDSMEAHEFMQEAHVMKKLQHANLVRLIGVCSDEMPMYIVTEFVPHGDLLNYLYRRRNKREEIDETSQLYMCSQICEGMAFLESQKVIHRDLAARNVLVSDELVMKIADFGMGRQVDDDLYTAHKGAKMPIKWSAPEALCYNAFSNKSDVWSFGIVLWEIVTFADTPYPDMERTDVLIKLEEGYRMEEPEKCPEGLYKVMRSCWEMEANDRPSFKKLMARLARLQDPTGSPEEEEEEEAVPAPAAAAAAAGPAAESPTRAAAAPAAPAAAAPPPLPARNAERPPLPPARSEDEGSAAAAEDDSESSSKGLKKRGDWRKSYRNKAVDVDQVKAAIDMTKDCFAKVMAIIRYGDDDSLKDQVKDMLTRSGDLAKAVSRFSKKKPITEPLKGLEAQNTSMAKCKPTKSKLEPHLKKMRDVLRDLSKALKELLATP